MNGSRPGCERGLGPYRYRVINARYEKVRQGSQVHDAAVRMEIAEDWQTAEKRYVTFGD